MFSIGIQHTKLHRIRSAAVIRFLVGRYVNVLYVCKIIPTKSVDVRLVQNKMNLPGVFDMHEVTFLGTKQMLTIVGVSTTEYALQHPNIQRLLHATDKHYDLILTEQFFQDAFLMFAHKFQAPIVSICKRLFSYYILVLLTQFYYFAATFGMNSYFDGMFGSFGAWAHVPHELFPVSDSMTFMQRVQNVYYCLMDKYLRNYVYLPQQQALADKYFSHLPGKLAALVWNKLSQHET